MVEDADAEQVPGLLEPSGEVPVLAGREGIARGVVVLCAAAIYVELIGAGCSRLASHSPFALKRFT